VREYTLEIREAFTKGLRPESKMRHGAPFLTTCDYAKPTQHGLWSSYAVEEAFAASEFDDWPFPQLFRGSEFTLLMDETVISTVDESGDPWTLTPITTYCLRADDVTDEIEAGGVWKMIDFGPTFIMLNGVCSVIRDNRYAMVGGSTKVLIDTAVPIQAGCAFRGRAIFGGFDPAGVWPDAWDTIFDTWLSASPTSVDYANMDIGENFVLWSPIGSYMLALYVPPDDPVSLMRQNQFGFLPMSWQGTVYDIRPLGDRLMVYGENGIAVMTPVQEPISTFGREDLMGIGVAGRGAVGGDGDMHVFIDAEGDLWQITKDLALSRLGYAEYLADFIGQEISISLDQQRREFYICGEASNDDKLSYVLTPSGLGTSRQQITSMVAAEGTLYGVWADDSGTVVTAVSDEVDFRYRDMKTVTTIEVGIKTAQDVHVQAYYCNDATDVWTGDGWVLVNTEGFARVQITALKFRIGVKVASYAALELDYVTVHWQPSGRRTVRGLSASQADQ